MTGKEYAIKMMEKKRLIKEKKVKYATTERDILMKCGNHPNIVKLYYTFKDETYLCKLDSHFLLFICNDCVDYVLELCRNGELLTQLKMV